MSKAWEVDPEIRAKLLDVQKQNGNNSCVDCGAPSPQWASPKFGIFMCLNCSGIHRGMGVHISFVRSVTMDGFKPAEYNRMKMGGNTPWQQFFDNHPSNKAEGRTFEETEIKDRYVRNRSDTDAGEEWKDRLTAKVEGKEYVPIVREKRAVGSDSTAASRSQTPAGRTRGTEGSPARSASPAVGASKKAQNEAYFAKMGAENAQRSSDLPPNQGGKFQGFGSDPNPSGRGNGNDDWLDTFQRDPMAGLTKGFGWLGGAAKTGYQGWVKPNVQKFSEGDLATQARLTAAQIAQGLQTSTKNAADSFNKFVEGDDGAGPQRTRKTAGPQPDDEKRDFWENFGASSNSPPKEKKEFWDSFGADPSGPPKEKKDFWDSFGDSTAGPTKDKKAFWDSFADAGAPSAQQTQPSKPSTLGTSAMKKSGPGSTTAAPSGGASASGGKDDEWNEW